MAKLHGTGSFGKNCMNCICHLIVKVTAPPFLPQRETDYHCGPKTVPSSSSGTKLSIIDSFSLICAGRRWRSKRCFFSRFPFQQTNSGLAARKKQPKLQTQNLSTFYLFLNIRSIDLVFKTKAIWLTYRAQKHDIQKNANLVPKYKKYKIESQVHVTLLLQLCGHFTSMVNEADMSTQSVFSFTRHNRHGTSNIRYDMYLSRQYGSHVPCTSFLKIHKGLYI